MAAGQRGLDVRHSSLTHEMQCDETAEYEVVQKVVGKECKTKRGWIFERLPDNHLARSILGFGVVPSSSIVEMQAHRCCSTHKKLKPGA